MTNTDEPSSPPPFDEEAAASYIGKYILVGLTYQDHEGNVLRKEQLHGVISSVSDTGIEISLRGAHEGRLWSMPPDLSAIFPADPGGYRLHSTNEKVQNPDFVCTWTITKPRSSQEH